MRMKLKEYQGRVVLSFMKDGMNRNNTAFIFTCGDKLK